ncbi:MAG: hypothetical protein Q9170_006615 [Blastenia crenularia]
MPSEVATVGDEHDDGVTGTPRQIEKPPKTKIKVAHKLVILIKGDSAVNDVVIDASNLGPGAKSSLFFVRHDYDHHIRLTFRFDAKPDNHDQSDPGKFEYVHVDFSAMESFHDQKDENVVYETVLTEVNLDDSKCKLAKKLTDDAHVMSWFASYKRHELELNFKRLHKFGEQNVSLKPDSKFQSLLDQIQNLSTEEAGTIAIYFHTKNAEDLQSFLHDLQNNAAVSPLANYYHADAGHPSVNWNSEMPADQVPNIDYNAQTWYHHFDHYYISMTYGMTREHQYNIEQIEDIPIVEREFYIVSLETFSDKKSLKRGVSGHVFLGFANITDKEATSRCFDAGEKFELRFFSPADDSKEAQITNKYDQWTGEVLGPVEEIAPDAPGNMAFLMKRPRDTPADPMVINDDISAEMKPESMYFVPENSALFAKRMMQALNDTHTLANTIEEHAPELKVTRMYSLNLETRATKKARAGDTVVDTDDNGFQMAGGDDAQPTGDEDPEIVDKRRALSSFAFQSAESARKNIPAGRTHPNFGSLSLYARSLQLVGILPEDLGWLREELRPSNEGSDKELIENYKATEPEVLVFLTCHIGTMQFFLGVGDPNQLSAVTVSYLAKSDDGKLINPFSRTIKRPLIERLKDMGEKLIWFKENRRMTAGLEEPSCSLVTKADSCQRDAKGSRFDLYFIAACLKEIKAMSIYGVCESSEIGIASPYRKQTHEYRRYIHKLSQEPDWVEYKLQNVTVNTVDSLQAAEKHSFFFGMTTGSIRDTGFGHIEERRRLHVANTRCKFAIVIVLDCNMMKGNREEPQLNKEQDDPDETDAEEVVADMQDERCWHLERRKVLALGTWTF